MDFLEIKRQTGVSLMPGKLLIAEPMLGDPNFSRSVIFLADYNEDGAIGFALNKPLNIRLGDVLEQMTHADISLWQGGPVQTDTLHMLHRKPELLEGKEISDGIFWGGSFEALQQAVVADLCKPDELRLFLGYSGWAAGQLEGEIDEGSWLIADASPRLLFETPSQNIWQVAVQALGSAYTHLLYMPANPSLN